MRVHKNDKIHNPDKPNAAGVQRCARCGCRLSSGQTSWRPFRLVVSNGRGDMSVADNYTPEQLATIRHCGRRLA
jgi:hypothetical protein